MCEGYELTGLARGGEQLSRLKRNYAKAVELLVELASLQVGGTHIYTIDYICVCHRGSSARRKPCR